MTRFEKNENNDAQLMMLNDVKFNVFIFKIHDVDLLCFDMEFSTNLFSGTSPIVVETTSSDALMLF